MERAFAAYVLQAWIAVHLLEAVNYFEHWGLERQGRRLTPVDSWDTDSRFTLYTLAGLSRHADPHAWSARPYQQLRYREESPKLPYGYFGTVVLLLVRNARFRELMTEELRRRRLGPFPAAEPVTCAPRSPPAGRRASLPRDPRPLVRRTAPCGIGDVAGAGS